MFRADAFPRIHYSRSHWQAAADSVHMTFRFRKRDVIGMSVPSAALAVNDSVNDLG